MPLLDPVVELRHTGVVKFRSQSSEAPSAASTHAADGDTLGRTRNAIVRLLLESGPITASQIGE